MNKLTKATIATAAGVALLIGGGSSLAYWNDQATITGSTITAGNLALVSQSNTGTWGVKNGAITTPNINIANFRAVPGDALTYTTTLQVKAQGDNLKFKAGITSTSIAPATAGKASDIALQTALTGNTAFTFGTLPTGFTANGSEITLTAPVGAAEQTYSIPVTVTITWPFANTPATDNPAKTGAVKFADFTVQLTQVAN